MSKRSIEELIHFSVINVNKPSGPLSQEVDQKIRRIFHAKKAGHSGTLDPKVSGVLVVALDEATKILGLLMKSDKEYEGIIHLHKDVEREKIEKTVKEKFIGEITQTPPVHSRVARRPRQRMVYSFDILEKNGKDVTFRTRVEAGTYIRKLCFDLGQELGVGAHMKYLKRTKTGKFDIKDSHEIGEIREAYNEWKRGNEESLRRMLIPIEQAIDVKKVVVKDSSIPRIRNGSPVRSQDLFEKVNLKQGETVGIFSSSGRIIGLGIAKSRNKVKTDRIFMSEIPSNK
ncbi:MAG: RNA-guided pseudouridylation complex pseudouridine synthase subunit Cbf5 [Candidatus Aenigmarchaeota archaeon]|nr:RNA-guided pseudouridylation complex pseudouridine synthase subunit Cbf5 [Candidatus Aenigmarchaeota archaeon]